MHWVSLGKFPYCSGFPSVCFFKGGNSLTRGTGFFYHPLILPLLELAPNLRFGILNISQLLRCRVFTKELCYEVCTLWIRHADGQLQIVFHILRLLAHLQLALISLGLVFRIECLRSYLFVKGIKRCNRITAICILCYGTAVHPRLIFCHFSTLSLQHLASIVENNLLLVLRHITVANIASKRAVESNRIVSHRLNDGLHIVPIGEVLISPLINLAHSVVPLVPSISTCMKSRHKAAHQSHTVECVYMLLEIEDARIFCIVKGHIAYSGSIGKVAKFFFNILSEHTMPLRLFQEIVKPLADST